MLQRHHGDAAVLSASTACLSAMATNPKYAAALIDSGAMMGMLESVVKNPDQGQGVAESLQLLETIATNAPEALLSGGGADASTRLIKCAPANEAIVSAAVRTLEKLNKVPGGSAALIECEAVKTIIDVAVAGSSNADSLESAFRLLERMCREPKSAEYIRNECNGMQILSAALEANTEVRVQKVGGRLLSKLASGSVSDLIYRLRSSGDLKEKEFLSGLLANLALEEENASKILEGGGITAIVESFKGTSKKTVESSIKALGRLASNDEAVEEIFRSGAHMELVKIMDMYRNDAQMVSAVTPTVRALVNSSERAQKVARSGGLEAVVRTLVAHPEYENHTAEALQLLDDLVTFDYDISRLVDLGILPALGKSLRAHKKNATVQLFGLRALIFLSLNEANVRTMIGDGIVEVCLTALEEGKKDAVVAAMYLVTSLIILPEGKGKVGPKGIDRLLTSLSNYTSDPIVKDTAEELLSTIVSEAEVQRTCADFGQAVEELLQTRSKPVAAKVKALATTLGAYCVSSEYAETVINADGLSFVARCIEEVSTVNGMPELEGILKGCSTVLSAIVGGGALSAELSDNLNKSGAIKSIITSVKLHPKLKSHVTAAVDFIDTVAQQEGLSDVIAEEGGVEACVAALRANSTSNEIVISAFNALLQIASSDFGAVAVAKHGGSRQVISAVNANATSAGFTGPMEKAVAIMNRVSETSEGADLLMKQGALDCVIVATDALAKAGIEVQGTSRVLARLLTREDVESTCANLAELASSATRGRVPAADAIAPVSAKLIHMTSVAGFTDIIMQSKGAVSLSQLVRAVLAKPDDDDIKASALPGIFKAVANLSKSTPLPDELGFAGCIGQAVEFGFERPDDADALSPLRARRVPRVRHQHCADLGARRLPAVQRRPHARHGRRDAAPEHAQPRDRDGVLPRPFVHGLSPFDGLLRRADNGHVARAGLGRRQHRRRRARVARGRRVGALEHRHLAAARGGHARGQLDCRARQDRAHEGVH